MGKSRKTASNKNQNKRTIRTRSEVMRKASADLELENQNKGMQDEGHHLQKDSTLPQKKSKYSSFNEDIDMYFASCFNSNFKNKEELLLLQEKQPIQEKNVKDLKKQEKPIIKHDMLEEGIQSHVQSSLANIEEINESQNPSFNHDSNDSPQFGSKFMKSFKTPSNKIQEFKVFDQSEEPVKIDFIDQLEEVSKDVSFPSDNRLSVSNFNQNFEIGSSVVRTEKRITKDKKKSSSKKEARREQKMHRFDEKEFSFKRSNMDDETKRRSQILRLTTLTSIHSNYDKSERLLLTLSNSLKSLLNYYNLRELNTKILSFRQNIFKALREEVDKLMNCIKEKKETCTQTIHEKMKQGHQVLHYCDDKFDFPCL